MVMFPGIVTPPFLVFIFLSLILSINSRPQNYNENVNWRSQPRSIDNNGYYANQRYNQPPEYHHLSDPVNYESFGYHRPRIQPQPVLRPRVRGPYKEVLPVLNTKRHTQNEYNSSDGIDYTNQAHDERNNRRFEGPNKKETTRILNNPPLQGAKAPPSGDVMLGDQSDFVFPGHPILQPTTSTTPLPEKKEDNPYVPDIKKIMSMCPPDATFCLYPGSYPSEHIKNVLKKTTEKYDDLFGRDEIASNVSISTRIDVTIDGTPMCGSKEQIVEPPVAKNKDNEWKFIVNDGRFVQGIRVEMCENAGGDCAMSENFPLSYKTECKQKFIYRKLLALENSGQIEPDTFRLPSCCACIFRQESPALRFMKPKFGTSRRRK